MLERFPDFAFGGLLQFLKAGLECRGLFFVEQLSVRRPCRFELFRLMEIRHRPLVDSRTISYRWREVDFLFAEERTEFGEKIHRVSNPKLTSKSGRVAAMLSASNSKRQTPTIQATAPRSRGNRGEFTQYASKMRAIFSATNAITDSACRASNNRPSLIAGPATNSSSRTVLRKLVVVRSGGRSPCQHPPCSESRSAFGNDR